MLGALNRLLSCRLLVGMAFEQEPGLRWLSPLELGRIMAAILRGDVGAWRAMQPALADVLIGGALMATMFWRYRSREF